MMHQTAIFSQRVYVMLEAGEMSVNSLTPENTFTSDFLELEYLWLHCFNTVDKCQKWHLAFQVLLQQSLFQTFVEPLSNQIDLENNYKMVTSLLVCA